MLSNKGKYGLKAMTHLAGMPPGRPALVADIAARNNIPKKFLDAILGELRNAGLVHSRKGRGGGYMLAASPSQIMVGQIIRVLDGPLAPIACASRNAPAPSLDIHAPTHSGGPPLGCTQARDSTYHFPASISRLASGSFELVLASARRCW